MSELVKAIVLGVGRNAIMGLGGALAAQGILTGSQESIVEGSLAGLLGVGLSLWDRFVVARKLAAK